MWRMQVWSRAAGLRQRDRAVAYGSAAHADAESVGPVCPGYQPVNEDEEQPQAQGDGGWTTGGWQQQEAQPPQPPLYIHTAGNRQPDLQRRVAKATPVSLIEGMQLYVDRSGHVVNSEGVMGPWRVEKPNAGSCLAI